MNQDRLATSMGLLGYTTDQLVAIGGVLVIVFGVIFVNNWVALRIKQRRGSSPVPIGPPFIGKYATQDGSVVGKVVAIEGDQLIIEQSGTTRKVAVSQARDTGHDVVLIGEGRVEE